MKTRHRPDVTWFRSIHYGGTHVCLWWMVWADGGLHVKAELVKPKMLIADFAQLIRVATRALGSPPITYTVGTRDQMSGKTGKGYEGETRATTFRNNGILIRQINFDDVQGWTRVRELFGARPDGRPWLTIDPKCDGLIRAITNATSDPADEENIIDAPNDQPLKAMRIGAMSRPAPKPFAAPPLPKHAIGHDVNALRLGTPHSSLAWR